LVPDNQIHDFNPGIDPFPTGLFWTIPIPPGSVHIDLAGKTASLKLRSRKVDDYGNVVNALATDTEIAAAVIDVDISWSGGTEVDFSSSTNNFSGHYVLGAATFTWSAKEPGFSFTTDPGSADFAEIGHERNGSFNI